MRRAIGMNTLLLFIAAIVIIAISMGCGEAKKEASLAGVTDTTVQQAATVGVDVCLNCHSVQSSAWLNSRHSNGNFSPSYSEAGSTCTTCHDPLGDGKRIANNSPAVGCESCHGGGEQHWGLGPIAFTRLTADANGSGQYNTCTSCHELLNGTVVATPYHSPDAGRMISDTHYDDPATTVLEGYNPTRMSEKACSNCHNPHSADLTINKQWAQSGHGDLAADPWSHYPWKDASRAACQRCHTATGAANYLNSPAAYNPANNNFSHLTGSQLEVLYCNGCHTNYSGGIRNPGAINANYNVTINYPTSTSPLATYAVVSYSYPDAAKANVCMACHTGRENGESIKQLNVQAGMPTVDFNNLSFINSHYLTAGGTIFTATGYEFTGLDYTSPAFYKHDKIGTVNAPNTGSSGPCVGCHMSFNPEKHLFLPVTRDVNGTITALVSTLCGECHPSDPSGEALAMTVAELEAQKAQLANAMKALQDKLDLKGFYFNNAHPYFYRLRTNTGTATVANGNAVVTVAGVNLTTAGVVANDLFRVDSNGTFYKILSKDSDTQITLTTNYAGAGGAFAYTIIRGGSTGAVKDWATDAGNDATGAASGKNNMGSAFNYNLIEHDPGAFAHNRVYTKRLIFDSIDWLDGTMDGIINLTGYADAITYYGCGGNPAACARP